MRFMRLLTAGSCIESIDRNCITSIINSKAHSGLDYPVCAFSFEREKIKFVLKLRVDLLEVRH